MGSQGGQYSTGERAGTGKKEPTAPGAGIQSGRVVQGDSSVRVTADGTGLKTVAPERLWELESPLLRQVLALAIKGFDMTVGCEATMWASGWAAGLPLTCEMHWL